jgi:hypothetical protein
MEQLIQNTGLLVVIITAVTELIKWAFPKYRATALVKIACFAVVSVYTLSNYAFTPEVVEYFITQLVTAYLLSTKLYDVFTNHIKK